MRVQEVGSGQGSYIAREQLGGLHDVIEVVEN